MGAHPSRARLGDAKLQLPVSVLFVQLPRPIERLGAVHLQLIQFVSVLHLPRHRARSCVITSAHDLCTHFSPALSFSLRAQHISFQQARHAIALAGGERLSKGLRNKRREHTHTHTHTHTRTRTRTRTRTHTHTHTHTYTHTHHYFVVCASCIGFEFLSASGRRMTTVCLHPDSSCNFITP